MQMMTDMVVPALIEHEQHTENRISVQDQLPENAPVRMNNRSEYESRGNASSSNNEKVNKPLIQPPIFRPFSTPANSSKQYHKSIV